MAEYYAVERSPDYLMHYGVKGMRWGVRRAVDHGNDRAVGRNWTRANKKLNKLKTKADVIDALIKKRISAANLAGVIPLSVGISAPIISKASKLPFGVGDKVAAGFNAAAGLAMLGVGAHDFISGNNRSKAKGHAQAIKKVNDWQKEMKSAFKGTKYGEKANSMSDYNDVYTLYEHGPYDKEHWYSAPTIGVRGSDLVQDRNTKGKRIFKKRLSDEPVTRVIPNSKVLLTVRAPSGRHYSAEQVDSLLRTKSKKRRRV